jgi:hypothetical protein
MPAKQRGPFPARTANELPRDADCNFYAGIVAVVHVVAVAPISDVDVIVVVPVIRPVFRPRIEKRNPVTLVLESGVSTINHKRETVDPKPMLRTEIGAIAVLGNTVAVVAAALVASVAADYAAAGRVAVGRFVAGRAAAGRAAAGCLAAGCVAADRVAAGAGFVPAGIAGHAAGSDHAAVAACLVRADSAVGNDPAFRSDDPALQKKQQRFREKRKELPYM